jgi:hypothetical protein
MAKNVRTTNPQSAPDQPQWDEEAIARRAYELYERRGAESGHELDDWVQAERELREGRSSS